MVNQVIKYKLIHLPFTHEVWGGVFVAAKKAPDVTMTSTTA